ncbi:COP9 signalosome complex subunit 6-like [Antedon mediterranea]|uniref:COP9 signalosome complex subunit 6-like n=1 Tax=Antedon mediterranea TaxID=105859 RepID=UPI003AF5E1FF
MSKMEVDEENKPGTSKNDSDMTVNDDSVMACSSTTGSVTISLHPLLIMNISEHWTRTKAQEGKPTQVFGAITGRQTGRNIEIMNSFELMFEVIEGDIVIDREYYKTKEEQFKQIFQDDCIGWYTSGGPPSKSDIKVHKQICEINESPIFLKLNPMSRHTDLPITICESVIDLVNGQATMLFVELQYTIATEEAERIGVDHVARLSSSEAAESSKVAEHLQAQHNAIKMLHSRVKLILDYVKAVQNGHVPINHEIMRDAHSLCHRLPVLSSDKFNGDFYNQCNDVCLMAYLGAITKGCNTINQFVNKFNVLYDRQGIGRRMRGLFF